MVEEDLIREHLAEISVCESVGPDGMYPHVQRELAEVSAEQLSSLKGLGE